MDRDEALKLLRGGPDGILEWNRRRLKGEILPDLSGSDLSYVVLFRIRPGSNQFVNWTASAVGFYGPDDLIEGVNLEFVQLRGVDFSRSDIVKANFTQANLQKANFS